MKFHGFEEINHTADLALRVWGENYQELLIQAAKGFYHLLNANSQDNSAAKHVFALQKDTHEAMLVDFLNELLFLCENKKKILHSFSFKEEDGKLIVEANSDQVDSIERDIKAVTFHDLDIKKESNGLKTTVTFDV